MKVLWFSSIPLKQDEKGKFFNPGGNWILALKELIEIEKEINLGIVFHGEKEITYVDNNNTKYYQLSKVRGNKLNRFIENWTHSIESDDQVRDLLKTIDDFQPDVIQVFGTEGVFGNIITKTSVPVVIHIQGIINPYLNAWHIPKFKLTSLLKSLKWLYFIKAAGLFHDYYRFRKMAQRELNILNSCRYFMGRTHWDKAISKFYAPNSMYFHCDEVIRDNFYNINLEKSKHSVLIISSTINANIYKGLDMILNSAGLLKQHTSIDFEWHVYGINSGSEYAKFIENILNKKFVENNVILKGTTLSDDLLKGLTKSDIFAHCSYIDNSPNSVCEAQLIGLPVISTNVGGISSLITNNVDGILVPANEPHMLASAICDLYFQPDKMILLGQNGMLRAKARHDREKIKKELIDIYRKIIADK